MFFIIEPQVMCSKLPVICDQQFKPQRYSPHCHARQIKATKPHIGEA